MAKSVLTEAGGGRAFTGCCPRVSGLGSGVEVGWAALLRGLRWGPAGPPHMSAVPPSPSGPLQHSGLAQASLKMAAGSPERRVPCTHWSVTNQAKGMDKSLRSWWTAGHAHSVEGLAATVETHGRAMGTDPASVPNELRRAGQGTEECFAVSSEVLPSSRPPLIEAEPA